VVEQRTTKASTFVSTLLALSIFFVGGVNGDKIGKGFQYPTQYLSSDEPTAMQVGEELEYAVSYSFFSIGTISFKILDKGIRNGRTVFKARAIIESNPNLNWLKEVHIRFYGEIDDSVFSHYWISEDSSASGIDYQSLTFIYDDGELVYQKGKIFPSGERKIAKMDTIRIVGRGQDGLSLFFYARENARQKKQATVQVFIDDKEANAHINFQDKVEDVDIDAVDYPVKTVFLDGKADFVGVAGMTGGFRGWFSNDAARIPMVARLNVWIGSIKVELKSWKRQGWQPPRYVESH
jgi:hypothetical protein